MSCKKSVFHKCLTLIYQINAIFPFQLLTHSTNETNFAPHTGPVFSSVGLKFTMLRCNRGAFPEY